MSTLDYMIDTIPVYMQPYEWTAYRQLKNNSDYIDIYCFEKHKDFSKLLELNSNLEKNYSELITLVYSITLEETKKLPRFRCLRGNKFIDTIIEDPIPKGLIRCDNCGNIWDGNAQCTCLLYDY